MISAISPILGGGGQAIILEDDDSAAVDDVVTTKRRTRARRLPTISAEAGFGIGAGGPQVLPTIIQPIKSIAKGIEEGGAGFV